MHGAMLTANCCHRLETHGAGSPVDTPKGAGGSSSADLVSAPPKPTSLALFSASANSALFGLPQTSSSLSPGGAARADPRCQLQNN